MAGWDDLVSFVRMRYEVMRQNESELWFNVPTGDERTQIVAVRLVTGEDDHPWAQITSPVGTVDAIDLAELLALAGQTVAGGAVAEDGLVLFRHSIPLGDTALDGFDRPFRARRRDGRPAGERAHRSRRALSQPRAGVRRAGLRRATRSGRAPGRRPPASRASSSSASPTVSTPDRTPDRISSATARAKWVAHSAFGSRSCIVRSCPVPGPHPTPGAFPVREDARKVRVTPCSRHWRVHVSLRSGSGARCRARRAAR